MSSFITRYVQIVDSVNRRIGRFAMYLIFMMLAILLYSSISKTFFFPSLWTLEMAQFTMVAYYILGGPYSLQEGSHVRMDLFYGEWTPRGKAWVDAFTIVFLLIYLGVLLYGAIGSTEYAIFYGERSNTAWRPYMWPIKMVMCFGIISMIFQALSEFFKDIARIRGVEL